MTDLDKLAERAEAEAIAQIENAIDESLTFDQSRDSADFAIKLLNIAASLRTLSIMKVGNTGETGRSSTDGEGAR